MSTKIEWAANPDGTQGETWNPVTGCTPAGKGCAHCYAARMHGRFQESLYGGRPFSTVVCHEDRLDQPLKWKKPRTVFVDSMGDLFHENASKVFISRAVDMMERCKQHTFIILTKRIRRVYDLADIWTEDFPKNVFIGPSCSTQDEADRDIPGALSIPGNIIVSLEPLLGPVDLSAWLGKNLLPSQHCLSNWVIDGLSGVIVGGETGPGARPMHPDWVRSLRDQCAETNTPFFFKQWGEWLHGSMYRECLRELPNDLARLPHLPASIGQYARIGKRRAGRLLDGRTHDDLPWKGML